MASLESLVRITGDSVSAPGRLQDRQSIPGLAHGRGVGAVLLGVVREGNSTLGVLCRAEVFSPRSSKGGVNAMWASSREGHCTLWAKLGTASPAQAPFATPPALSKSEKAPPTRGRAVECPPFADTVPALGHRLVLLQGPQSPYIPINTGPRVICSRISCWVRSGVSGRVLSSSIAFVR